MAYRHKQLPLAWLPEPDSHRAVRLRQLDALDDFLLIVEEVNLLGGPLTALHPWLRERYRELGGHENVGCGATLVEAVFRLQEPLMREPVAIVREHLPDLALALA